MIYPISVAILFSLHQIVVRAGVLKGDPNYGAFISLLTSTIIFLFFSALFSELYLNPYFLSLMILGGILHFLIARLSFYNAVKRIGANSAGAIASTRMFFAVLMGALIGERVELKVVLMAILIFSGISLILNPGRKVDIHGFSLAILTAFTTASSSVMVKVGMTIHPDPIFGSAIGYLSASLIYPIIFNKNNRKNIENKGYFIIAGIIIGFAHFLRYYSLVIYPVSIVEPLISTAPIFTLFFSRIFLREMEILDLRLVIGVILVVIGIESYFLL